VARQRRLVFGEVAELYDRARPSYPADLVRDVVALMPPHAPREAVEIGAGTGKATLLFAERGLRIVALEPSGEMAAVARRRFAGHDEVEIVAADFERWDPRARQFPLLFSAQAWHWVSPREGYVKAAGLLLPGGLLAAFWNRPDWARCSLRPELIHSYAELSPEPERADPMHPASQGGADMWSEWERGVASVEALHEPELRRYPWTRSYTTQQYLELLQTNSRSRLLEPSRLSDLLRAVGRAIDAAGGHLELAYDTWLYLARAR
jgi:SAM-dependent methyltransferase